jgi:hypothetical protein
MQGEYCKVSLEAQRSGRHRATSSWAPDKGRALRQCLGRIQAEEGDDLQLGNCAGESTYHDAVGSMLPLDR